MVVSRGKPGIVHRTPDGDVFIRRKGATVGPIDDAAEIAALIKTVGTSFSFFYEVPLKVSYGHTQPYI